MAIHPAWTVYRLAHVHMMLLGFVTMMIYGRGAPCDLAIRQVPLHSRRVALSHRWTSNIGLLGMVTGDSDNSHPRRVCSAHPPSASPECSGATSTGKVARRTIAEETLPTKTRCSNG